MSLNRKKSRPISIDGVDYRWLVFENSGWNDLTVQHAEGEGQKLVVQCAWENKSDSKHPYQPVTPALVVDAVTYALAQGWQPRQSGGVLRCNYEAGQFSLLHSA